MKTKNANSQIWSNKDIFYFGSGLANVFLVLFSVLFLIYLVAPLLGGKLSPKALIIYGSLIGFALSLKYTLRYIKARVRMKRYKWYLLCSYFIMCAFLWFPYYLGIIFSAAAIISFLCSYKAQGKSSWQDER
jgi:hypothetical protein